MTTDTNSADNTYTSLNPPDSSRANAAPKESWPGAFGLFKHSKEAVSLNLSAILVIVLVQVAASMVFGLFLGDTFASFVQIVVSVFIQAALVLAYLAGVRHKRVSAGEQLSKSPQFFVQLFLLQILVSVSVGVGFLLFVIPGLILLTRLFVAQYYLIDKNMSAIEAYKASLAATKGSAGKVWGIIGVTIVMTLPAFTIIGIPITIYLVFMYGASAALLYQYLTVGTLGPEETAAQSAEAPMNPPDGYMFNQPPQS